MDNTVSLKHWYRDPRIIGLLVIIPMLSAAIQVDLPGLWGGFLGDAAVYYAMADSIAQDGDLQYTRDDLVRISERWPNGPQGILLVADDAHPDIIHYAKPLLYSLLASPFVGLLHENGMLLFNVILMLIILICSFSAFSDPKTNRLDIVIWSLTFWCLSAIPAYIFSLTPDLFNSALVMAGLTPLVWIENHKNRNRNTLLLISTLILGIAFAARPPNGLFLIMPLWLVLFPGKTDTNETEKKHSSTRKRILMILAVFVVFAAGTALLLFLTKSMTGQAISHGGFRKRIVGHMPFEAIGLNFLNTGNMISTRNIQFVFHWNTLFHNLRYYFIGHFTGLIPYFFPAFSAMVLALPIWSRESKRVRMPMLLILAGMILFHLVYIPTNYHGGSCAVGNRYLISYAPAFFLLLRRPPKRRTLLAIVLGTALLSGPIAINPMDSMANYREVSKRKILSGFPPEITLLNSWPVDDPRHVRVVFDEYFMYFADDNQWGKENNGFWSRGDAQANLVLRCWEPVKKFQVNLSNGGSRNTIRISAGSDSTRIKCEPGKRLQLEFEPGNPVLFYNLAGNPSYCYQFSINNTSGFIPKFTEPGSTDARFLGSFIEIKINS